MVGGHRASQPGYKRPASCASDASRGVCIVDTFSTDVRIGLRRLIRNRGLTLVALTSLAVAIGVSVAILGAASSVLLRPLPYKEPDRLAMVWTHGTAAPDAAAFFKTRGLTRRMLAPERALQWRTRTLPFEDMALIQSWQTSWLERMDLVERDAIQRLRGSLATANLFSVLGVQPALGRTFTEGETGVAILSAQLWRQRFGGDPDVLGKTITLATGAERQQDVVEIVGVLPDGFQFDHPDDTEIWLPLSWTDVEQQFQMILIYRVVARLRDGLSLEEAEAAMQAIHLSIPQRNPTSIWLEPLHDYQIGPSRRILLLLSVLAGVVLLSGAVNAATALTAAAVSRLSDLRVQRALGATPGRLMRHVFIETALIAVAAGLIGLATAALAFPVLRVLLPSNLPRLDNIRVDGFTLAVTFGTVVVTTLVAGLVPAWLSARGSLGRDIESRTTATMTPHGLRLRLGLLAAQFALVTGLLIAAGILGRSFWNVLHVDKGFSVAPNVYATELQLMHPVYREQDFDRMAADLLQRVRTLPYVSAVSVTSAVPLWGGDYLNSVRRDGGEPVLANMRYVTPGYFDVMGIRVLGGRTFTEADRPDGEWVIVISQSLADTLYPGENPVGRLLEGTATGDQRARANARIIGVVADVRGRALTDAPAPAVYWPRALLTSGQMVLLIRALEPMQQIEADVRRVVSEIYREQPVWRFASLQQILDDSVADRRASAVFAGVLAVAMVLLSGIGLLGHLSQMVVERRREVAIRAALGASPRRQRQLLWRHVAPALVAGIIAAVGLVYGVFPLAESFVFGIDRFDPLAYGAAVTTVVASVVMAMHVPARRVINANVATILRST